MTETQREKKEAGSGSALSARVLSSATLFEGEREVIIAHSDQHYRLQITKAGKLILIK